jgi:DNA topoisomerase-1
LLLLDGMTARRRTTTPAAPPISARRAGLRYVDDRRPGIRRVRTNRGFRYLKPNGQPLRDRAALKRIRTLAIPPAYEDVWICPYPNGHLQATGHDARGRKQYRYHPKWREVRDGSKYEHMVDFGRALPKLREQVARHLRLHGLPREKVLATVVRLLDETHIRVGNDEYAKQNGSFGLTTLRDHHATIHGSQLRLHFKGKSGVVHDVALNNPRLAKIVRRCRDIPGQELFQYLDDDGRRHAVNSTDVNEYLREITGKDFTAKDFRTWSATVAAAAELGSYLVFASLAEAKRNVVSAVAAVADRLRNTASVCRKCYIHPAVIDAYLDGKLPRVRAARAARCRGLRNEERAVLRFLKLSAGPSTQSRSSSSKNGRAKQVQDK